jgi:hypothetical protein
MTDVPSFATQIEALLFPMRKTPPTWTEFRDGEIAEKIIQQSCKI